MAKFLSVLISLIAINWNLFFTTAEDYAYRSYYNVLCIIIIPVSAVVCEICIYPANFCEIIIELAIATFLLEFILIEFIVPCIDAFVNHILSIAEDIKYLMSSVGLDVGYEIYELLETGGFADFVAGIAIGAIYPPVVYHVTRVIDLKFQCKNCN